MLKIIRTTIREIKNNVVHILLLMVKKLFNWTTEGVKFG